MEEKIDEEFWVSINTLQENLRCSIRLRDVEKLCTTENKNVVKIQSVPKEKVIEKLEKYIENFLQDISKGNSPSLSYNNRKCWGNTRYNENVGLEMVDKLSKTQQRFASFASVSRFAATFRVMAVCYKLLQEDNFATKRDIYYSDVPFFGNQKLVDDIVDNLACMLEVPRHSLHILATSKGCISGELRYREHDGHFLDCRKSTGGVLISAHVESITDITSTAKFILVVEKEAIFQRLLDDGILKKLSPCIVMTGKGFPDVNTRKMLNLLFDELQIPVFALVDADPYGIEILSVYKFGSKSLSFDAHNLTVPSIKWLGVLPSDIEKLSITAQVQIPLTTIDMKKTMDLLKRSYIQRDPAMVNELDIILKSGLKAEIQSLCTISANFITEVYLPTKLRHGLWV